MAPAARRLPAVRIPGVGKLRARPPGGREPGFPGGGSILGGVAIRNAAALPPPPFGHRRPLGWGARWPGRHPQAPDRALRPAIRRFVPLHHGLPPAAHGRRGPPRVAPARAFLSPPAALRNRAEIHGRLRNARHPPARHHPRSRRPAPPRSVTTPPPLWRIRTTSSPRSEERRVGKECRSRWEPY